MPVPSEPQIQAALQGWPSDAVYTVASIVRTPGFAGVIAAEDVQIVTSSYGLPLPKMMLGLTAVAKLYAQPPISNFYVGAVVAGGSGTLYFGCNMEYAGRPLTFCSHGEQDAVLNAWTHFETSITAVAVNAAPCGYCRQYLNETVSAPSLDIILGDSTTPLAELLPHSFGPRDLGIGTGLLEAQDNGLTLQQAPADVSVLAALYAANVCYAPYTKSYSGAGLLMNDGQWFAGPLSENAAYNPSQSPLEAALFLMNIAGYSYSDIAKVALVEVENPVVSQLDVTQTVLRAVSSLPLSHVVAVPSSTHGAWVAPRFQHGVRPKLTL